MPAEYTLTVRNGSTVERSRFARLEEAIAALRESCEEIVAEGPLPDVSAIREYSAAKRVKARLEISTGKLLRRREAGVDVMGDGSVVPYSGGTFRKPIEDEGGGGYAAAVESALRE